MENEWAKFCEINTKAYDKIQATMGSSITSHGETNGSGLQPSEEEMGDGIDSWSALCYELTNTLYSTRDEISRIRRSLSNDQEGRSKDLGMAEDRHNTTPPTSTKYGESKGKGRGLVMQFMTNFPRVILPQ